MAIVSITGSVLGKENIPDGIASSEIVFSGTVPESPVSVMDKVPSGAGYSALDGNQNGEGHSASDRGQNDAGHSALDQGQNDAGHSALDQSQSGEGHSTLDWGQNGEGHSALDQGQNGAAHSVLDEAQNNAGKFEVGAFQNGAGPSGTQAADAPWYLTLVNRDHPLPENYMDDPIDLADVPGGEKVDVRIYNPLMETLADAKELGPIVVSCSWLLLSERSKLRGITPMRS